MRVGRVVERHLVLVGVERRKGEGRGRGMAEVNEIRLPLRMAKRTKGEAIVTDGL